MSEHLAASRIAGPPRRVILGVWCSEPRRVSTLDALAKLLQRLNELMPAASTDRGIIVIGPFYENADVLQQLVVCGLCRIHFFESECDFGIN